LFNHLASDDEDEYDSNCYAEQNRACAFGQPVKHLFTSRHIAMPGKTVRALLGRDGGVGDGTGG
jgi:hypothetical protein